MEGDDYLDIVYVGPEVYTEPEVLCSPPCLLIFPPSSLTEKTTITPNAYTTSLEYGEITETTVGGQVVTTFLTTTTAVTLQLDPVTTDAIQCSNFNIAEGLTTTTPITMLPSIDLPPVAVPLPDGEGESLRAPFAYHHGRTSTGALRRPGATTGPVKLAGYFRACSAPHLQRL